MVPNGRKYVDTNGENDKIKIASELIIAYFVIQRLLENPVIGSIKHIAMNQFVVVASFS